MLRTRRSALQRCRGAQECRRQEQRCFEAGHALPPTALRAEQPSSAPMRVSKPALLIRLAEENDRAVQGFEPGLQARRRRRAASARSIVHCSWTLPTAAARFLPERRRRAARCRAGCSRRCPAAARRLPPRPCRARCRVTMKSCRDMEFFPRRRCTGPATRSDDTSGGVQPGRAGCGADAMALPFALTTRRRACRLPASASPALAALASGARPLDPLRRRASCPRPCLLLLSLPPSWPPPDSRASIRAGH